MTSTPSTRRQLDGVALWSIAARSSQHGRCAPDSLVDLRTGHGLVETEHDVFVLVQGQRYGEGNSHRCWVIFPGNSMEIIHRERAVHLSKCLRGDQAVDSSRYARQDQDPGGQVGLLAGDEEGRDTAKCGTKKYGRHL